MLAQLWELSVDDREDILKHIVGIFRAATFAPRDRIYHAAIARHEFAPCLLIAAQACFNQFRITASHKISANSIRANVALSIFLATTSYRAWACVVRACHGRGSKIPALAARKKSLLLCALQVAF